MDVNDPKRIALLVIHGREKKARVDTVGNEGKARQQQQSTEYRDNPIEVWRRRQLVKPFPHGGILLVTNT
jgi:hypothetical protein